MRVAERFYLEFDIPVHSSGLRAVNNKMQNSVCATRARKTSTGRQTNSTSDDSFHTERLSIACADAQRLALHLGFSGQHEELDKQLDQPTRWVPSNGRSTSYTR